MSGEEDEEERKSQRVINDVIIQVESGGVTRTVKGILRRSTSWSWRRRVRGHLVEAGRSLLVFFSGLLLASLYGLSALVLQKQSLWLCVYTTLVLAALAAFGMGVSQDVRVDIMVMLPSLCSARGRNFILLLYVSMLLSGPLSNTLSNSERAASSLLCSAQLAANQTQELIQRSATPLFSVVDKIQTISRNAYEVAGRVQNLIQALTDSVRHIARTLRNVLEFLVDIGDVCNDRMGSPYRNCRSMFLEARSDCVELLGDFSFLCGIVDVFLPLCDIARAGELFCVIPSYIASHLREHLAAPTIAAFDKLKREFEFNLTASVSFDLDVNSSRSLQEITQNILEEISSDLQVFQIFTEPLTYIGLLLIAWSFFKAVQYRRKYLRNIKFDNTFIGSQFEEFDRQVTSRGGASALPLTSKEAETYIKPFSFQLTMREQRTVLKGVVSVLRHLVIGTLLVALDFMVFWILDQVQHQVKGDVVARAPVSVAVQVNGSGYASDIYRDLVASFDVLQRGNVTVISRKCLLEPTEPDHTTTFILGFLIGLSLLVSLTGGFVKRCRRLVCAYCYPEREQERIRFLHQHILDQRRSIGKALRNLAFRIIALRGGRGEEEGEGERGEGEGGGRRRLQSLLKRLPGGVHLLKLTEPPKTCNNCGEQVRKGEESSCDNQHCAGLYCRPCFQSLGNECVVCIPPPTLQEDNEEELDSSDDEQIGMSAEAPKSTHVSRTRTRTTKSTATLRRPTREMVSSDSE